MTRHSAPAIFSRPIRVGLLLLVAAACGTATDTSRAATNLLFLGNSLTIHSPSVALGWSGNWGMAASDSTDDYAHQLSAMFPGALHRQVSLGSLETSPESFNPASIDTLLDARPTIVVVELGDNATDVTAFDASYRALLMYIATRTSATILCTTTWFGNANVDAVIRAECASVSARVVELSPIAANPQYHAGSERTFIDSAVAAHPGDRGMAAIAAALYSAIR